MAQKEKLEEAKRLYQTANADQRYVLESLFPELKESEDEMIRKALIEHFRWNTKQILNEFSNKEALAWLEKQDEHKKFRDSIQVGDEVTRNSDGVIVNLSQLKRVAKKSEQKLPIEKLPSEMKTIRESLGFTTQEECDEYNEMVTNLIMGDDDKGEQKHDDKVKPKFKVGDYVVGKYISGYISEVRDDCYLLDYQGFSIDKQDNYHLWTIADAKEGDVLCYETENKLRIFIYKNGHIHYHCCYYNGNLTTVDSFFVIQKHLLNYVHPATKEQRDLLFQKMHEAGYEWDAEKKELKKIEQKPTNEPKFKIGDYIERKDGVGCHAKIIFVGGNFYGCEKLIYPEDDSPFFEFMFENQDEFRVSSDFQQKLAWNEEDDDDAWMNDIISKVENNLQLNKAEIDWIKLLKERYFWKPSDEQMVVLELASKYERVFTPKQIDILIGLKEQLKKLKGE